MGQFTLSSLFPLLLKMNFMDLLLVDALARAAAAEANRPPPDNFFVLAPEPQVIINLYLFTCAN